MPNSDSPYNLLPIYLLFNVLNPAFALDVRQVSSPVLSCYQDNPIRALTRFFNSASTFCPSYLATNATNAALPTSLSGFDSKDVSSACTCFQASATTTFVVLTLGPSSRPATFTQIATLTATPAVPLKPSATTHPTVYVSLKGSTAVDATSTVSQKPSTAISTLTVSQKPSTAVGPTLMIPQTPSSAVVSTLIVSSKPSTALNTVPKGGPSTGSTTVIAVVSAAVGLAVILGAAIFMIRRRKGTAPSKSSRPLQRRQLEDNSEAIELPPTYEATEADAGGNGHEAGGEGRYEIGGNRLAEGGQA